MFKTIQIIVMAMLCIIFNAKAQSQKILSLPIKQAILGKIISATTGEALPGAVIKVTTVNHTVVSTNKGEFILTLSNGAYNLSVSHIGYKTKSLSIRIPQKEQLVIALETDDLPNKTKEEQLVQSKTNIKPLKIGDTIPEAVWNMPLQVVNHPEGKQTITLNDYKGKLIILDFWATWCSPCIASLDKLVPIYKQHRNEIVLLPISSHNAPSLGEVINVMKEKNWGVPSVVDNDQFLYSKVFPPSAGRGIPHMVWIKNNKVIAIPKTAYATHENILKAIKGTKLAFEMDTVDYFPLRYNEALFVNNNGNTNLYYSNPPYSKIAHYLQGYGIGIKTQFIRKSDTTILAVVNRRLQDILFDAWGNSIFPALNSETGIVWEISNSLEKRLFNIPKYDKNHLLENDVASENWKKQNTYGYQLIFPEKIREKEAYYFMQQDLSQFFSAYLNLDFKIINTVKHTYATLKLLGDKQTTLNLLRTKGKLKKPIEEKGRIYYYYQNYKQSLVARLGKKIPGLTISKLIDSTGIDPDFRIDYEFPTMLSKDTSQVNSELKKYGLYIEVKESFVPVLLVKERISIKEI